MSKRQQQRNVYTVEPSSKPAMDYFGWYVRKHNTIWTFNRKSDAIKEGIRLAKVNAPSQLIIKGRDGRVQKEHTYPRSSDPKRHRG